MEIAACDMLESHLYVPFRATLNVCMCVSYESAGCGIPFVICCAVERPSRLKWIRRQSSSASCTMIARSHGLREA